MKNHHPVGIFAGSTVQDTIMPLNAQPGKFDGKATYTQELIFAGGSAANGAAAMGMEGRKHFHRECAILYTPLGDANNHVNLDLSQNGVVLRDCSPADDFKLHRNFCLVGGHHRFIGKDGTAERNKYEEAKIGLPPLALERLHHDMNDADIVMIDTRCPLITTTVARKAQDFKVPVVLDAGGWKEYLPTLISLSDIVIASHDLKPNNQDASPEQIIQYLKSLGKTKIAVTRGKDPTLMLMPDGKNIKEFGVTDRLPVIDTCGAGDIMHGAFCFFYALTNDMGRSIELANEVASESTYFLGPREGIRKMAAYPEFEVR